MNTIKKTLLTAFFAIPMMAMGADYPWLTFKMTDGSEMSVAAEGLAINYNEGSLQLKSATVDQTIASDMVASMRFTTAAAAVEGITDLMNTEADYFDISGKLAGRFSTSDEARKALSSGTYIVRSNGKTIKVIF